MADKKIPFINPSLSEEEIAAYKKAYFEGKDLPKTAGVYFPESSETLKERLASKIRSDEVEPFSSIEEKKAALSEIKSMTHARVNPITKQKEYLLFRGLRDHDLPFLNNNKYGINSSSSWTWNPTSARDYGTVDALSDLSENPRTVAAWVPETLIKNYVGGHHGEVIVSPTASSPLKTEFIATPSDALNKVKKGIQTIETDKPFGFQIGEKKGFWGIEPKEKEYWKKTIPESELENVLTLKDKKLKFPSIGKALGVAGTISDVADIAKGDIAEGALGLGSLVAGRASPYLGALRPEKTVSEELESRQLQEAKERQESEEEAKYKREALKRLMSSQED